MNQPIDETETDSGTENRLLRGRGGGGTEWEAGVGTGWLSCID